jgi:putative hydrolase of the HAD superfamily
MPLRAVLFDAGETLVHPSPSFPELFTTVLASHGYERAPDNVVEASRTVFHRFSEAARDRDLWTTSPESSARFWKGVYARMLDELDIGDRDGLAEALYETFTDQRNYSLFDDVVPTLDGLEAAGLALGIVSNFEAWLEELLATLGVRERFAVRVISGREGVEKPDPAIFELALDRLGIEAGNVAYVGDNPAFDLTPARALGMTAVLIDRRDRFPDEEQRITDLRDLVGIVRAVA